MLIQLIVKCGYTVAEVAEALKVSTRTIKNWSERRNAPTQKQSRRLSRFLGIDEQELFG